MKTKTLIAAFLGLFLAQLASAEDKLSLAPSTGTSEKEMLAAISDRLLRLEERMATLEKSQQAQYASLRDGVQIALNQIGDEIGKLKAASTAASPPASQVSEAKNPAPPPVTTIAGPSVQQWWKVKSGALKREVARILGEPKKITPNEEGELWNYDGGGWVQFYSYGVVKNTGGYGDGN